LFFIEHVEKWVSNKHNVGRVCNT